MARRTLPERHVIPETAAPRNRELQIIRAGYFPAKTQFVRQAFTTYGVGLVVAGRGTYRADGGVEHRVEPGCMFIVRPNVRYDYGALPGSTWEEYYLSPSGAGVKRWFDYGWMPDPWHVYPLANTAELIPLFRELLAVLASREAASPDRATAIAERLVMEMYYGRLEQHANAQPNSLHAVLAYCQANFAEPIDFKVLAQKHAMSYSRLRHGICELTHMPPAQYLMELRCNAARTLLAGNNLSIKEIAQRVGIADPYSFSRVFKRHVGVSPNTYREQMLQWNG